MRSAKSSTGNSSAHDCVMQCRFLNGICELQSRENARRFVHESLARGGRHLFIASLHVDIISCGRVKVSWDCVVRPLLCPASDCGQRSTRQTIFLTCALSVVVNMRGQERKVDHDGIIRGSRLGCPLVRASAPAMKRR